MDLFCVKPKVCYFQSFREFPEEFALSRTDLVLTESIIFDRYIKPLDLPCTIILKDQYDLGEPNDETIDRILSDTAGIAVERIVAIGGGSVIDIGKMMMIRGAYPFRDVVSGKTPIETDKALIVIPTTCGTGSEVTNGGIVTMKETGLKTGIMSEKLTASFAVLIPEFLEGLPHKVFMYCSVDALSHSMESFLSPMRGNEMARAVGARSIELILGGYAEMIRNGQGIRKRLHGDFIVASCLGGMAVNNGGAGPVHALAEPLGEKYKMSHGESVYQFLSAVLQLYLENNPEGEILLRLIGLLRAPLEKAGFPIRNGNAFEKLEAMLNAVHPAHRLHECGMVEDEIGSFAENIIRTKQRLIVASYIPFTEEHAKTVYRRRY
jgi:4-hydroxybutyrate dehydrogenase